MQQRVKKERSTKKDTKEIKILNENEVFYLKMNSELQIVFEKKV